jgi:DNA-binding transcriptional LysR family regulator
VELRHLRYAVAVAEAGSFTRAASRLNLAQQALSQQIADLERELGLKLFDRTGAGARPTPAGGAFIDDARSILARSAQAVAHARGRAQGESGRLTLGLSPTFRACNAAVAGAIARFHRRYPDVEISVVPLGAADRLDGVRYGPLDLAVAHGDAGSAGDIAGELLWEDSLGGVLLPAAHPLAGKAPLWLRDLADLPLLAFPRQADAGLLDQVLAALAARGLRPSLCEVALAGFFPDLSAEFLASCEAGRLGPRSVQADLGQRGGGAAVFRPVADEPIPVGLWVLWRRDEPSPLVKHFVATCRELGPAWRKREPLVPVGRAG